jgi:uncharacterized membrane protein YqjE
LTTEQAAAMCITIPSSANVKRARQWIVWQWLAASPLRLYLIGGVMLLFVALSTALATQEAVPGWFQFNLLFALIPCLLLAPLFEYLPGLLKVTPLTYVRFASLFFLLLLTQLLFHADGFLGQAPGLTYLLSLGIFWGLVLVTLRGMLRLSFAGIAEMAVALFHLLLLAGIVGLLIATGLISGWLPSLPAYAWIGLLPIYLSALLVLAFLRIKARVA